MFQGIHRQQRVFWLVSCAHGVSIFELVSGDQGESLVLECMVLGCRIEGSSGLVILGTGMSVAVVVELVIAIGLGNGTRAIFGGWAERRVSTTLAHKS